MSLIFQGEHPLRLLTSLRRVPLVAFYTMSHVPPDWKARAPRPLPHTLTFSQQDALPRLPVPELTATLTKLEKSLRPLAHSVVELETARKKITALGEPGGFGSTLHERLLARANNPKHINWLEEFWDDAGFVLPHITSIC
jgi:carnitine O-acetyltransferase